MDLYSGFILERMKLTSYMGFILRKLRIALENIWDNGLRKLRRGEDIYYYNSSILAGEIGVV